MRGTSSYPRVVWDISNYVGYLELLELCEVSRIMRGTPGFELDGIPQVCTMITWSYFTHRHMAFYYFSYFSPNNYYYEKDYLSSNTIQS